MTTTADVRRTGAVSLLAESAVTVAVLLLSFAAFDDITTGNETDFRLEYAALLVSAGWLFFVAFRLIRGSRWVLGVISLVALVGAVWGQREIRVGITPGFWPAYVLTTTAFIWFFAVAVVLFVAGWRAHPEWQRHRES